MEKGEPMSIERHNPQTDEDFPTRGFPRWRLVCHSCRTMWAVNTAYNPHQLHCCNRKELHVHNIDEPCEVCCAD